MDNPLTAADAERLFLDALDASDTEGVEAALTVLASQNPSRARDLTGYVPVMLRIRDEISDVDEDLRPAVIDGHATLTGLVEVYQDAKRLVGPADALTEMLSTLINDTDPAVTVAMVAAAVLHLAVS